MTDKHAEMAQSAAQYASRQKRNRRLLGAGIAVVAVVAAAIATITVLNAGRTPLAAAERYVAHLAAGEAEAANAMTGRLPRDAAWLTDDVMDAATELIDDVEVTPHGEVGDVSATFEVSYTLAGEKRSGRIRLERGEPTGGVLANWSVTAPLVETQTVLVNGPGAVSLAGVPLELDSVIQRLREQDVTMYPGVYPVEVPSGLFKPDTEELAFGSRALTSGEWITLLPTNRLSRIVQEESDALLSDCVQRNATFAEECPLIADPEAWESQVHWEIVELPRVKVEPGGATFSASGGVVRHTYTVPGASQPVVTEKPWSYQGVLEFDGDDVRIEYRTGG